MTAPYDARWYAAAAGLLVDSTTWNKIQDALTDLVGAAVINVMQGNPTDDGAGVVDAAIDSTTPEQGYLFSSVGAVYFYCATPEKRRLSKVVIKAENSAGIGGELTYELLKVDLKWDDANVAPAQSTLDGPDSGGSSAQWEEITLTPASPNQLTDQDAFMVKVIAGTAGDHVAGVAFHFDQLTVTNP